MKKTAAFTLAMALTSSAALAIGPDFQKDTGHSASIIDRSTLYLANGAPGTSGASTGQLQALTGFSAFNANQVGAEQRTIFQFDAMNLGTKDFSKGLVSINELLGGTPFTNGELRGFFTNTSLTAQELTNGAAPGPAGTNEGNLYFSPNGGSAGTPIVGPRAEVPWTDTVLSTKYVGDGVGGVGGDGWLIGGAATRAGNFGGLIQVWFDPTPFSTGGPWSDPDGPGGLLGQEHFIDGGLAPDLFPTISGPLNADAVLVLEAVLTPIFNFAPGDPLDAALLNTFVGGSGELGPPAGFPSGGVFVNGTSLPADTVLVENIEETSASGSGVGFLNIIGGDPDFISQFQLDVFGPGRDIRFDFDLDAPGGVGGLTADGWALESDDPVQFLTVGIPEPVTAGLGLLGLATLGGYVTRRRRA